MPTPELLAPCGGRSQLEAAIRFGADAVYLGTDRFGMRQRADNFSLEEVFSAVEYAHAANVRVFVTLNTLMHARDIALLPTYIKTLAEAKVDAFIVGDLGAFSLAQKHAPDVALHISTQASVANAEAARMWYEMGAARVVCAREMSIEDIACMRADAPPGLQLEAFVHGAMCMAVSGRCLISSVMTGRSGNKGFCTQPCRWSYALVEEKRPGEFYPIEQDVQGSYLLNAEDLNMIEHLDDLTFAGIDSFKIEGRNKRAFYVASVVHAYRSVLDGADPKQVAPELLAISHRPYGTGFYYGSARQAVEKDGYLKECLHVATVKGCECIGKDIWRVRVVCHNRFCEGEHLEALSPYCAVRECVVKNLEWLPHFDAQSCPLSPVAVAVANRASEIYSFEIDMALGIGDFLRARVV